MQLLPTALALLAGLTVATVTVGASARPAATCTSAEQAQRRAALAADRKRIPAERAAYFAKHRSASQRAAFVRRQQLRLKALQVAASCTVRAGTVPTGTSPPRATAPTTPAGPLPAPSPGPGTSFSFGSELPAAAQDEIKGDVAYAVQDEAALLGASIASVSTFASKSADWLADQQNRFGGYNSDSYFQSLRSQYASGSSAAQGGNGGIFIYWAAPAWQFGPGENQKIIAHELFHVVQYQLDHLVNNGSTPSSQVRPSGPVWLDEGSAELIGYRVAADRRLFPSYSSALASQVARARQIGVPLGSLETLDQSSGIPNVYTLFHVAVDHLVAITPAGVSGLTTYLDAIGAGMAWHDAFSKAFGLSVEAYYANFAAYRAGL